MAKREIGPKQEPSTLQGWMEVITENGKRAVEERKRQRDERCGWLRSYFAEDSNRIRDLGETKLVLWEDGHPVLNSKFSDGILESPRALEDLWEEIARRASFDTGLRLTLGMEIPDEEG